MDIDLIDHVYRNDEVEGVAIASPTGEIIENQLAATDGSVQITATTIANIAQGLAGAKRKLRGFLLKSDDTVLQVCVFDDGIVFIQLSEPFSATKIEKSVRSIFGTVAGSLGVPSAQAEQTQEAEQVEEVAVEEVPADAINLGDFTGQLEKLLKRVAPGNVAAKMVKDGFSAANVDLKATQLIGKQEAIDIGSTIIDKIPNASRRKIVIKEYDTITTSL